ncbi:helix-turn-helix domain-containing protein [uncultured Desulfovibrio sp.]|uniref:helix-turn-helix domain-containing protein n=1 Tax=uncultured Desulfovibrio sp. TaxID=167968 RepID=UPI00260D4797|nr:helix-turn-helix domain-containing protein [uncultured Desulfovibrio sp.]
MEELAKSFAPKGKIFGPILPTFVLKLRISQGAKIMYALLCNYAGEKDRCWPSQGTLAEGMGCSVSTVKNYIRELQEAGLLAICPGRFRSLTYLLLQPQGLRSADAAAAPQPKVDYEEPNSGYRNNLTKNKNTNNPPTPVPQTANKPPVTTQHPRGGGDFLSANYFFEKFWAAYPRKEAKELARSAWHRLWRRGVLPTLEALLEALSRFRESLSWKRENGRFVPQLANWLRGQRWLDELPASSSAAAATDNDAKVRAWEVAHERQQADPDLEAVRPQFDAFLARFRDTRLRGPAWGLWALLHKAGHAPQAHDVTDTASSVSPLDFLKQWKRAHAYS